MKQAWTMARKQCQETKMINCLCPDFNPCIIGPCPSKPIAASPIKKPCLQLHKWYSDSWLVGHKQQGHPVMQHAAKLSDPCLQIQSAKNHTLLACISQQPSQASPNQFD
jgi:hypothetical protein